MQEKFPQDQAKNHCKKAITQKYWRDVFVPTSHSEHLIENLSISHTFIGGGGGKLTIE